ncbi:3-mercaptopyruvate sulfurtransferase-like [Gigantopelta aegis]|uniref:3-mercaptopyruvate sulfurtransferase-like n=1 Tax=Gigantopelta aegis TaxID=1735272 RepID=UPI001B887B62|nr:3-mercaptopyruvate sulfurtransferase-like [Gigantopelta aegis]
MNRVASIVSVKWLNTRLFSPNLRVIDASWHLPNTGRNAREEYVSKHIPDAQFFDIDECIDKDSPYIHMMPSTKEFEDYVGKLGINNHTHVVVYDNNEKFGTLSAPRVWWAFRAFGHTMVSILDGGFPKWCQEHKPTTSKLATCSPEKFTAAFNSSMVKYFDDIKENLSKKQFQLMDARPPGRFMGTDPEPRPSIKPGHIPGSVNIPFFSIMDPDSKLLKEKDGLQKMFTEAGIHLDKPVVASCGSGVSACCLVLAAHLCGNDNVPVYDGAWTEWFMRSKPEEREACPEK